MNNKMDCEVIQDLLPLYYDDVLSETTKQIVKEHIEECPICKKEFELISKTLAIENRELSTGQEFLKAMKNKKIKYAIIKISVVLLIFCLWFFSHPITLNQVLDKYILDDTEIVDTIKFDNYEIFFLKDTNTFKYVAIEKTGPFYSVYDNELMYIRTKDDVENQKYLCGDYSISRFEDMNVIISYAWKDIEYMKYDDEFLKTKDYDYYSIFYGYSKERNSSITPYDENLNPIDFVIDWRTLEEDDF